VTTQDPPTLRRADIARLLNVTGERARQITNEDIASQHHSETPTMMGEYGERQVDPENGGGTDGWHA
jgi:hypothetical protein